MSRHDKDPREKHDPSKSDSSSDELAEQEQELEHLTIEQTIDDSDESKPQESPKQGPSVSKDDPLNKPTAGQSGLQESRPESADLEPKSRSLGARPKEKTKHSSKTDDGPTIYENFPRTSDAPTIYENFPRTSDAPTIYENFPRTSDAPTIYENFPRTSDAPTIYENFPRTSDAPTIYENFPRTSDSPTIYENQVSPPSMAEGESESSEAGISNYIPSNSENTESTSPVVCQSSTGVTLPCREEGAEGRDMEFDPIRGLYRRRNILDRYRSDSEGPQVRRAAYATESQNTSSDFSEIRSETADISAEASAYPKEFPISVYERQSTETSDTSESTSASSGKTTSESISMDERLTQSFPEDAKRRDSESGVKSEPSPSKVTMCFNMGKVIANILDREDAGKAVSISCPALDAYLKCTEPGRSYSVGMERKESSESESSSEAESSQSEESRKAYQKSGQLKKLQQSTISSGDSFTSEEANSSPSRQQDPSVETKDSILGKMAISPDKDDESAAENVDSSKTKLSMESSQASGYETGETSKCDQIEEESERSARKNKRDSQLSSSPQSDDMSESSPKAEKRRPKKKARPEEVSEPTVPRSVSLDDIYSTSTSEDDITLVSEHEGRTQL